MENFLFTGAFWGAILIIGGVLIVINGLFHMQIPTMRILAAVILVSVGIMILTGGFKMHGHAYAGRNTIIMESNTISSKPGSDNEYSIVMGNGVVDLSGADIEKQNVYVKINTVLGSGVVEVPEGLPVKISASAVFGDVRFPDNTFVSFGHDSYNAGGTNKGGFCLYIDANTVFGSTRIVRK